jgi:hypothetical protein
MYNQPNKSYLETNSNYKQIVADTNGATLSLNSNFAGFANDAQPTCVDGTGPVYMMRYDYATTARKTIKAENSDHENNDDEFPTGKKRQTSTQLIKEIYPWMKDNRHTASAQSNQHSFSAVANSSTSSTSSSTHDTTLTNRGLSSFLFACQLPGLDLYR